jgi:hypothetical protein
MYHSPLPAHLHIVTIDGGYYSSQSVNNKIQCRWIIIHRIRLMHSLTNVRRTRVISMYVQLYIDPVQIMHYSE